MDHPTATFAGLLATASGITVSMLPEVEAWLRVLSLILGCLVALASLYAILRNRKPNPTEPNDPL